MFGVALDMKVSDFRRIAEYPKSVAVGLTSQLILLPILTVLLIFIWKPFPSIALGLIMIAACPGGNISNFAVYHAKGNAALSVTLTSIVTLGAIITTPLNFALWSKVFPETQLLLRDITVDPLDMFRIIIQLILVPLIIGMFINARFHTFAEKVKKTVKTISLLIFVAFIVFALSSNVREIREHLHLVFLLVIIHNILAMLLGYYFAKANKLKYADRKAISMETGVQNGGLGLVLIFNFFDTLGGMILVAAWWGVWLLISSLLVSSYWSRDKIVQPDPQ
jgi:BASS family bile acid:Na+ symporter